MKLKQLTAIAILLVSLASIPIIATAIDFVRRMESSVVGSQLPRNAVVFTGQFDRIHAGLALLRERRIERLFISGVNSGAGIRIEQFANEFRLDAELRLALSAGRLELGPKAQTTEQNAVETACWFRAHGLFGPILLITSSSHMPRASLALERALPAVPALRMIPPRDRQQQSLDILGTEFIKFAASALGRMVGSSALIEYFRFELARRIDPFSPLVCASERGQTFGDSR